MCQRKALITRFCLVISEVRKRGWRSGVGNQQGPKHKQRMCPNRRMSQEPEVPSFWVSPLFYKAPQDNFSLQNVNRHPPKRDWRPSNLQFFYRTTQKATPLQFTFWRASICVLGSEIVLGVLYRKGGTHKKVGTLGFPQNEPSKKMQASEIHNLHVAKMYGRQKN